MHLTAGVSTRVSGCAWGSCKLSKLQHARFAARALDQKRSSSRCKQQIVRAFTVTLDTPEGEQKIECDADTYILDAADDAGLDLPYSCRSGTCGTCAAKVDDISQIEQVLCNNDNITSVADCPAASLLQLCRTTIHIWKMTC